jgi:Uma2 family endonuclease
MIMTICNTKNVIQEVILRTHKASEEGLTKIRKARVEKDWAIDDKQARWLKETSKILEPEKNWELEEKFAVEIGTWKRFLAGKAIKANTFKAFCQVLELNWEEVVDTTPTVSNRKNIKFLSNQEEITLPATVGEKIMRPIHHLRSSRCLIVIDHAELTLCLAKTLSFSKSVKGESLTMVTSKIVSNKSSAMSLEDWMENPPVGTEWVDGELIEKNGMTLKHSRIQGNLCFYWKSYKVSSGQGGEVYTDVPCRTNKQGRQPDVAYLTPELVTQYSDAKVLPQSFPLCAEIVSPTDLAEDVIAKSTEYLQSGGEEVWLVFPDSRWIIVVTQTQRLVFVSGEIVSTQTVLPGFSVAVDELLT